METGPALALLLTFIVHVVGMVALYSLMGREMLEFFRGRPQDGGGDDGGEPPADDPVRAPEGGGGGLPLPTAEQSPVRLREPGRLTERRPRPARRPDHRPERAPQPDRAQT
jgi:hypothetical protein